jgi:putative transposase
MEDKMRRELYISAIYHIYNRGNNRLNVFPEDEDKKLFLDLIFRLRERLEFKVYAICLMDNHYHMIVQANRKHNISRIMHVLAICYSNYYRRKYKYIGHLWQSRFKSRVIEREKYLFECIDYIHLNPVKAGIVREDSDYKYSSAAIFKGENDSIETFTLDSLDAALHS